MTILKTDALKAYYVFEASGIKKSIKAVNTVSLEINKNEIYGVAGESGCGKSTFLKTLVGMIDPPLQLVSGKIYYNIEEEFIDTSSLSKESFRKLRWNYISYIPQGSMSVLNPVIRIQESFRDFIEDHCQIRSKDDFERPIKEHLTALGLPLRVLRAYPHQLSGGMRQRVTIALATVLKPKIIVADEPTTALDVVAQRAAIQLLKDIQKSQKNTVILVTHDMAVHANISDRVGIMYAGTFIEEAKTEELFQNPLHPYTKYLIGSLPKIGDKSYKVSAPGSPPSLTDLPAGCPFHPRCSGAMGICRETLPEFIEVGKEHKVACFLISEEKGR